MDDQKSKRLFIAFITFILGLTLGGGLVMFCSGDRTPDQPAATTARGHQPRNR